MADPAFIPYEAYTFSEEEMKKRAHALFEFMDHRRTVRDFSDRPIPGEILEQIIRIANTAPSGANKQPWTFCLVTNPLIKQKIRMAAEAEEYENYHGRMSEEWLEDLAHLGTDWKKPFLEIAPALIVVFRKAYDVVDGKKYKNYYVQESVGLACGFLLAAIHHVGLVTLTHTPSPMNFLQEILGRPDHEKPFLLIPVAFPAQNVMVPNIHRKNLDEVLFYY
ncbi:MAG TPA: nitroreductase family protein [Saprospiraceae bacterium]|nr:nitroreductase family protein [Saprospiraceae bacterium]